ncbi:glycosyltransferase 87 family protein [Amycolatopsis sp. VS8301801F10]|uniref:glycosyltransferase 87 family protein n=1 Tax=Amycolatopsis sp. VS8301801F10 TaxID=2652442 RepID=UPI0038FD2B7B
MRQEKKIVLGVAIAVLTGIAVVRWLGGAPLGVDSAVYRAGALAVLRGQPLYEPLLALDPKSALELPFTYPPSAALLFLPLAALPVHFGWLLIAVGSVLALWSVTRRFARERPLPALCLLPVLEPVWRMISLGQINGVLMAMVVLDALPGRNRRSGGMLIGLAAAVKLTPLIFVPYLFLTGRRADAWRALGTFLGTSAAGALLLPGDSIRYWTSAMLDNRNAGTVDWVLDQSLHGMFARFGATSLGWYAASAALCLLAGALLVREFHRRGDPRAALLVTAACGLLVSPLSWTHHWIWAVPLVGFLSGKRAGLICAGTVFSGIALAVVPEGGHRELSWNPVEVVLGNAYVLSALAVGAVLSVRLLTRRSGRLVRPARQVR